MLGKKNKNKFYLGYFFKIFFPSFHRIPKIIFKEFLHEIFYGNYFLRAPKFDSKIIIHHG